MDGSYVDGDTPILLDPQTVAILNWVLLAVLCQAIAVFGVCANVINIVCFIKPGLKDSVDVSLFGLAVSDLGSLISVIWCNICNTPAFAEADLPFDVNDVFYFTAVMTHLTFVRITSWITALITLERCLCVTMPIKIRNAITMKRECIVVVCIFLGFTATGSPMHAVSRFDMKFITAKNKTLVALIHTADREAVKKLGHIINNTVIPILAFVIITACTVILVITLRKTSAWRQKSTSAAQADVASHRTQKVTKMVVMISSLFIVCFIPMSILFIPITFVQGLNVDGRNVGTVLLVGGTGTILESINAGMNIFIYYNMSSKYRVVFRGMICFRKEFCKAQERKDIHELKYIK